MRDVKILNQSTNKGWTATPVYQFECILHCGEPCQKDNSIDNKGFYMHSNSCLYLKISEAEASTEKGSLLLYRYELWHLWKRLQVYLILINHASGFNFTINVGCLHNQNLGIWCMKPNDTKQSEISGAPFPLALCDGGLNVILFLCKIFE